ncbi:hypothetical protein K438DRAFT_1784119 [Mycena galopus ATCC 62051]|nr:hypothetical protein K438DRAFT_1784119 [Mycena galopus ATCC 62051]
MKYAERRRYCSTEGCSRTLCGRCLRRSLLSSNGALEDPGSGLRATSIVVGAGFVSHGSAVSGPGTQTDGCVLILAWMDHGRWVEGGWGLEGIHLWTNTHLESWTRREYKSPSCRLEQFPRLRLVWLRWPGVAARLDDELTCELDSKQQQVGEGEKRTRDDYLSELMHQMSVLAVDGVEGGGCGLSLD